jgi:hypothetical protein
MLTHSSAIVGATAAAATTTTQVGRAETGHQPTGQPARCLTRGAAFAACRRGRGGHQPGQLGAGAGQPHAGQLQAAQMDGHGLGREAGEAGVGQGEGRQAEDGGEGVGLDVVKAGAVGEVYPPEHETLYKLHCILMGTRIRVPMRGEGGGGGGVSANEYSCAHHVTWNPNKLWRSNSILNLCQRLFMYSTSNPCFTAVSVQR